MKPLSPIQQRLLTLLTRTIDDPLTVREIQSKMHFSSTSVAAHHIGQLEKKGYLRRDQYNSRNYEIVSGGPERAIVYLNLYGLAQCGPEGSILESSPMERIPVSTRMLNFSSRDAFMVKAKGNSMEPRIYDGDYVIAKKAKAAASDSIVICVNNEETLIKKFHEKNHQIILVSLNSQYAPMVAAEDFRIEGEVKGIISGKMH